ncbi:hypothetical protein MBLNU459_g3954t1 [Dothideomycetes sp. NU459]
MKTAILCSAAIGLSMVASLPAPPPFNKPAELSHSEPKRHAPQAKDSGPKLIIIESLMASGIDIMTPIAHPKHADLFALFGNHSEVAAKPPIPIAILEAGELVTMRWFHKFQPESFHLAGRILDSPHRVHLPADAAYAQINPAGQGLTDGHAAKLLFGDSKSNAEMLALLGTNYDEALKNYNSRAHQRRDNETSPYHHVNCGEPYREFHWHKGHHCSSTSTSGHRPTSTPTSPTGYHDLELDDPDLDRELEDEDDDFDDYDDYNFVDIDWDSSWAKLDDAAFAKAVSVIHLPVGNSSHPLHGIGAPHEKRFLPFLFAAIGEAIAGIASAIGTVIGAGAEAAVGAAAGAGAEAAAGAAVGAGAEAAAGAAAAGVGAAAAAGARVAADAGAEAAAGAGAEVAAGAGAETAAGVGAEVAAETGAEVAGAEAGEAAGVAGGEIGEGTALGEGAAEGAGGAADGFAADAIDGAADIAIRGKTAKGKIFRKTVRAAYQRLNPKEKFNRIVLRRGKSRRAVARDVARRRKAVDKEFKFLEKTQKIIVQDQKAIDWRKEQYWRIEEGIHRDRVNWGRHEFNSFDRWMRNGRPLKMLYDDPKLFPQATRLDKWAAKLAKRGHKASIKRLERWRDRVEAEISRMEHEARQADANGWYERQFRADSALRRFHYRAQSDMFSELSANARRQSYMEWADDILGEEYFKRASQAVQRSFSERSSWASDEYRHFNTEWMKQDFGIDYMRPWDSESSVVEQELEDMRVLSPRPISSTPDSPIPQYYSPGGSSPLLRDMQFSPFKYDRFPDEAAQAPH